MHFAIFLADDHHHLFIC